MHDSEKEQTKEPGERKPDFFEEPPPRQALRPLDESEPLDEPENEGEPDTVPPKVKKIKRATGSVEVKRPADSKRSEKKKTEDKKSEVKKPTKRRVEVEEVLDEDDDEDEEDDGPDVDYDEDFATDTFDTAHKNPLQMYFAQASGVLLHPKKFFAALPAEGWLAPTVFLVVSASIYAFLQALGNFNPFLFFKAFASSLFYAMLGSVIVWAVFSKGCKGKGTLCQTYRVIAYSKATLLIAWISAGTMPLGGFISVAFTLFLNYVGLKKVHKLKNIITIGVVMALGALAYALKHATGL